MIYILLIICVLFLFSISMFLLHISINTKEELALIKIIICELQELNQNIK